MQDKKLIDNHLSANLFRQMKEKYTLYSNYYNLTQQIQLNNVTTEYTVNTGIQEMFKHSFNTLFI